MTNNWADMANSTLFVAMGSNFVENHPAATAHVLRAYERRPDVVQMIVIDPRKTRTAILAESHGGRYIRFRPGTDIAFNNAVAGEIIRIFENADGIPTEARTRFFQYLNQAQSLPLYPNGGGTPVSVSENSVYTDARFKIRTDGQDYVRSPETGPAAFLDLPEKAALVDSDPNTVYNKLKAHLAPYTPALAAEVCGCTAEEITFVARAFVNHSRMMSSYNAATNTFAHPVVHSGTNGSQDPRRADYRAAQMMYAMGLTQHTKGSQNVKGFATIQTLTGNVGRAGAAINALRGIHNVQGSTDQGVLQHLIPGYSGNPIESRSTQPNAFGRYCDNLWGQPTRYPLVGGVPTYDDAYGKQDGTGASVAFTAPGGGLQARGFYNMTLKWFGSYNAIHTGTTFGDANRRPAVDMIYDLWPKSNGDDHITMFRKMAAGQIKGCVVWGQNPAVTEPNQSAVRAGFRNLDVLIVTDLFENETAAVDRKDGSVTYLFPACSHVEEAGSVANSGRVLQWRERACAPKGNSRSDIEMLMRFAYAVDKADGFSHILAKWNAIVAGTGIDQWWGGYAEGPETPVFKELYADQHARGWNPFNEDFEAIKDDIEMWYANKSAPEIAEVFGSEVVCESIYRQMNAMPSAGGTMWLYFDGYNAGNRSTRLHGGAGTAGIAPAVPEEGIPAGAVQAAWLVDNRSKSRSTADPNGTYAYPGWGYSWLANRRVLYNNLDVPGDVEDRFQTPDSVARLFVPAYAPHTQNYGAVGYANNRWRRVHGLADRPDTSVVVTDEEVVLTETEAVALEHQPARWVAVKVTSNEEVPANRTTYVAGVDYTLDGGEIARIVDGAIEDGDTVLVSYIYSTSALHLAGIPGRFTAHTEPYETPLEVKNPELLAQFGRNTRSTGKWDLIHNSSWSAYTTTKVATNDSDYPVAGRVNPADYPLVLTTIRCVEHFQGGPITRNNSWNVEAEPEPWVEINSVDAGALGIKSGDYVNVVTARGASTQASQGPLSPNSGNFTKGFVARVGVGAESNQRVGPGTVAIPWHWGDKGLSTGARANDLCIDAFDTNTRIPEYKACLCKIEKIINP